MSAPSPWRRMTFLIPAWMIFRAQRGQGLALWTEESLGVYAGEIQVGAQGLGTGAVKQGIFFRMDGTADVISLALMHV